MKHLPTSPIDFLKTNILARFENTNPGFAKYVHQLISDGTIQRTICYYYDQECVKTPFVSNDGYIHLQSTFLSFLWIHCYYTLVIHEEVSVKHFDKKTPSQQNIFNNELINKTIEFQQYAMSLVRFHSEWDLRVYPGPNTPDKSGKDYHIMANQLFLYAVDYVMCHEFAHLELKHFTSSKPRIDLEKEADKRAYELMLSGVTSENKVGMETGILIALCSLLFLSHSISGGGSHPDKHERIKEYLETINPPAESHLWSIACMLIGVWENKFSLNIGFPSHVADHKEMFYNLYPKL